MRIVFFGTSEYCLPVLEVLKKDLVLVVTREDKPEGRKKILTAAPTKIWCQKNDVPVKDSIASLQNDEVDLGIVADYGRIIPESEFNRPRLGTFNIHFSKLPDLRGASPVQNTLLRGDKTAWITIQKLEKTLDTGPILWQKEYPILPDDTAQSLYTRLFEEVAKELPKIDFTGKLTPQEGTPTFCKKLTKEDGYVELDDPNIYNKYRAYYPWPGIWTIKDGKRMIIRKCHLDGKKFVLDEVQFEGGKPINFQAEHFQ